MGDALSHAWLPGIGLLFISHNLKTIQQVAERVLVMDAGKIVEDAGVEELFRQPASLAARRLLEARL
jgi:ABC-type dipeptide/oligopeptide/nickel transport system ATPase component